jgi:hypothetical protein
LATGKACVYSTGSFGRKEAGEDSDLDLFIVGLSDPSSKRSSLPRLDEICIKADLIETTRKIGIPDFDGDGRYLTHYNVKEFTSKLGKPDDDVLNTFTGRLLLLLESKPLLVTDVYNEVTSEVIAAYWRDYEDHKTNFAPAFVANDILRMWRTFCVNYEARTEREPEEEKVSGKLKNYSLKHSRLLTCYSALLYLLFIYNKQKTASPSDAVEMVQLTPTERLEWLLRQPEAAAAQTVLTDVLARYEKFLKTKSKPKTDQLKLFSEKKSASVYMNEAGEFGDKVFEALNLIGNNSRLHRILMV